MGQRDYALLLLMMQTGLRLAEVTGLRDQDLSLGVGAHVRCEGKGRKERCTPLTRSAAEVLRAWLAQRGAGTPQLFPNARGGRLSHDAVQDLVAKYAAVAQKACPSLQGRRITPHMLRHTAAMELLQAGIDRALIALWLGHESVETTQVYLDANLVLKEQLLERTQPTKDRVGLAGLRPPTLPHHRTCGVFRIRRLNRACLLGGRHCDGASSQGMMKPWAFSTSFVRAR
jgi:integrase